VSQTPGSFDVYVARRAPLDLNGDARFVPYNGCRDMMRLLPDMAE